jgi:hypothetical protein
MQKRLVELTKSTLIEAFGLVRRNVRKRKIFCVVCLVLLRFRLRSGDLLEPRVIRGGFILVKVVLILQKMPTKLSFRLILQELKENLGRKEPGVEFFVLSIVIYEFLSVGCQQCLSFGLLKAFYLVIFRTNPLYYCKIKGKVG